MAEDLLQQAHQILHDAVAGTPDDGWDRPTPCGQWNVAQVAQHAALDQLLYVASITGGPRPDGDAFAPDGVMAGSPLSYVDSAITASRDAFATVAPDAEAVGVPLPPFSVSAPVAFGAAALDAAVHGWDVAVASGQTTGLTDAVARLLNYLGRRADWTA